MVPEGLREGDARLLGDVRGPGVLEVGAGAAQCSRWLTRRARGRSASTVSLSQLAARRGASTSAVGGRDVPLVQADAQRLPFADEAFDLACSAYGAVPFVADSAAVMREVARVLRPGGRWVFSVTHPIRWCFPDDPGPEGLVARTSYFDRRPYVEQDEQGTATYVEHHRTLGDRVRELVGAGLGARRHRSSRSGRRTTTGTWGQWSPLRGELLPGDGDLRHPQGRRSRR